MVFSVQAGEIQSASVTHQDGVYTVTFDALVFAPQVQVYRLMTDYAHLHELSDSIVESGIIQSVSRLQHQTRLLLHTCILFFCQEMELTEDINTNGRDQIDARVIPEQSDFKSGTSHWLITPVNEGARLALNRQLEPDFWIPPVIGPWLIKKNMLQELSVLIERLEYYAGQDAR